MRHSARILIGVLVTAVAIAALLGARAALSRREGLRGRSPDRPRLIGPAGEATGFARAEGPRPFDFPADYGPHPDFQTEWWYYTGNLATEALLRIVG